MRGREIERCNAANEIVEQAELRALEQQRDLEAAIRRHLPEYLAMGESGMADHSVHVDMGHMRGPENTLPMMTGRGPFGPLEMGGMFTVVKIRDGQPHGDYGDPGWYRHPPGTQAWEWNGELPVPDAPSDPARRVPAGNAPST